MMKVAFRVDVSPQIGFGHLSRCLSLAQALKTNGAEVSFILSNLSHAVKAEFEEKHGFSVHILGDDISIDGCAKILKQGCDWLIIDGYSFDINFERAMRPFVSHLAVIDDLVRTHDCDLLIDQNLGRQISDYEGKVPKGCEILAGPAYALLDQSFIKERMKGVTPRKSLGRVLCYFGGGQVERVIISAMEALDEQGLAYDLVLGGNSFSHVRKKAKDSSFCHLFDYVDDMASLMSKASLFLGSGGMTNWERCCLGLPSLIVTVADNQTPATKALAQRGALLYLGSSETIQTVDLGHGLATLKKAPQLLESLGQRALEIVDGRGIDRVVKKILRREIDLRLAQEGDCEDLWKWRNAPENRRFSHDDNEIPLASHRTWFAKALQSMNRELLIATLDSEPVGVLRFDLSADEALVSIYLVPGHHGRGLGEGILRAGEAWLRCNRLSIRRIRAEIQKINKPSEKVFLRAGYEESFGVWYNDLH